MADCQSRFIELFGDPATNPKGWITKPLLDMGYCKNGMNFHTGDSGIEMHCLGVGDFKDLSVIDGTENLPVISLNEAPPEESMLRDGDIVFVRSNGNKALVGRCLVVYPHYTPTTYSGFCIRYRLTSSEVNTAYLTDLHVLEEVRQQGRGNDILDYCTSVAKQNGCTNIELRCDSVGWLSEWYIRKGFNVVGLQLNKSIE